MPSATGRHRWVEPGTTSNEAPKGKSEAVIEVERMPGRHRRGRDRAMAPVGLHAPLGLLPREPVAPPPPPLCGSAPRRAEDRPSVGDQRGPPAPLELPSLRRRPAPLEGLVPLGHALPPCPRHGRGSHAPAPPTRDPGLLSPSIHQRRQRESQFPHPGRPHRRPRLPQPRHLKSAIFFHCGGLDLYPATRSIPGCTGSSDLGVTVWNGREGTLRVQNMRGIVQG